ncbi:SOS response-associated peptidase [Rhodococcus sp. X156]|uniref:SOS response-associated peptidase n=1 Tax=Rhodococcus sp. X156 TaxID=2499145 RepID=UPI000FD852B2|nr:SOS response-associated peptidase [Rhodococcus sp. X156]
MCGRFATTQTDDELLQVFGAAEAVGEPLPPSYNVAPTDPVRTVLERVPKDHPDSAAVRQLRTARWGLIPSWAKDRKIGAKLINARMETITEKPSFKAAASRRRCLVPANGYYEWEKQGATKVPHFLHGDGVLAMAGLYELWRDPQAAADDPDRWVLSVTVLTTTASDTLGHIHDRSPVLVPGELRDAWLDPTITNPHEVQQLLAEVGEPHLEPYVVSTAVNNVANNSPELLRPV